MLFLFEELKLCDKIVLSKNVLSNICPKQGKERIEALVL
jgi:hypothetical protein